MLLSYSNPHQIIGISPSFCQFPGEDFTLVPEYSYILSMNISMTDTFDFPRRGVTPIVRTDGIPFKERRDGLHVVVTEEMKCDGRELMDIKRALSFFEYLQVGRITQRIHQSVG